MKKFFRDFFDPIEGSARVLRVRALLMLIVFLFPILFLMVFSYQLFSIEMSMYTKASPSVTDKVLSNILSLYGVIFLFYLLLVVFTVRMFGRLHQYSRTLEKRVSERTHTLMQQGMQDEAILSSLGEALFVVKMDGDIVKINKEAARILGTGIKSFGLDMGRVSEEYGVFYPDAKTKMPGEELPLGQALQGEYVNNREMFLKNKYIPKGMYLSVNARPIKNKEGKLEGVVITTRDITHEKELDLLKTEFLNLAAHDLRTPVTIIKGYLSLLLEGDGGKVPVEMKKMLEGAYEGSERLSRLIDDFLVVSRLEKGKVKMVPQAMHLEDVVSSAIVLITPQITQKHLTLVYKKSPLPQVFADPHQVKEILNNLLENALHFTQKGSITISHEISDTHLMTHITDTGLGISREEQEHLFEKFYAQQSEPTKRGFGLGLYVCQLLVKAAGGTIWVKSKEDTGSTFSFSLPLVKKE